MVRKLFLLISITLFQITSFAQTSEQFGIALSNAAVELTKIQVVYDPKYYSLEYPNGDLPTNRGVCTDVIVRAYRALGIDLQKEVHEDMLLNFNIYPKNWGLSKPDKNIDHRRVPNLMVYFARFGKELSITNNPDNYLPGDIVAWDLGGGLTHIGILINKRSVDNKRNLIVHNIGNGQEISDCLFEYKIIGHYRYSK
jgi:uncharacterized protein YijF (DUF1287 family)